jgi:hypothetical protein
MLLWHRTTPAPPEEIVQAGFRDGRGRYSTDQEHEGVWLSDRPLDENEGACGTRCSASFSIAQRPRFETLNGSRQESTIESGSSRPSSSTLSLK